MKKFLLLLLMAAGWGVAYAESTKLLEQTFTSSQGSFTIENVTKPEELPSVWEQTSNYGMKATAYYSNKRYATESWLISPEVNLAGYENAQVTINHAISTYFDDVTKEATVWARANGGEWQQMVIATYPTIKSGSFSSFEDLTLDIPSSLQGKKIQVGMCYTSTATKAGTWEIKTFKLEAEEASVQYSAVSTIAEMKALESGSLVKINFDKTNPGYIEYVYPVSAVRSSNPQEAYVRDNSGALLIKDFLPEDRGWHTKAGGALVGEVIGRYEVVNGMPRLVSIEQSKADNMLCLENRTAVDPVNVDVADLIAATWRADFVKLIDVSMKIVAGKYYLTDGTHQVLAENGFAVAGIDLPTNPTGYRYTVTGIVSTNDNAETKLNLLSLEHQNNVVDLFGYTSNSTILSQYDGETLEVYVDRPLQQDQWNTLVLPFSINSVADLLGNLQLAEFSGYNTTTNTLEFTSVQDMVAGKPYLIKPLEAISDVIHMNSVELSNTLTAVTKGTYQFVPVYDPTDLNESDQTLLFLDNTSALSRPAGVKTLGAFQAYFKSDNADASAKITVDGVTTGITLGTLEQTSGVKQLYDLSGRRAGEKPAKGIYVSKGEKHIIK